MPEVDVMAVKKPVPAVYAVSGLMVVGGLAIVMWSLMQKKELGYGALKPITANELMSVPLSPTLEGGTITVRIGTPITIMNPSVMYQGPGRNTYTYARIVQTIGGQEVSVYGSGVAGVFVGPATTPMAFSLIAAEQPQPSGCPKQALCAYAYGASQLPVGWICGAPPVPGPATVILEIHQNAQQSGRAQDADGFSSPTCGSAANPVPRIPLLSKRYANKILFTA